MARATQNKCRVNSGSKSSPRSEQHAEYTQVKNLLSHPKLSIHHHQATRHTPTVFHAANHKRGRKSCQSPVSCSRKFKCNQDLTVIPQSAVPCVVITLCGQICRIGMHMLMQPIVHTSTDGQAPPMPDPWLTVPNCTPPIPTHSYVSQQCGHPWSGATLLWHVL